MQMKDNKWKCAFCNKIISGPTIEKCNCKNTVKDNTDIKENFTMFNKKEKKKKKLKKKKSGKKKKKKRRE